MSERVEPLRGFIGPKKLLLISALAIAGAISPACSEAPTPPKPIAGSPRRDPGGLSANAEITIQQIRQSIEELRVGRPDCFIEDVQREISLLAEGRDTQNYRRVTEDATAIEAVRRSRKLRLERRARGLLGSVSTNQRNSALLLAEEYYSLFNQEHVAGLREEKVELQKEYRDLYMCDSLKFLSLVAPYYIDDLREGKIPQDQLLPVPRI
jgi:hypothetical protein